MQEAEQARSADPTGTTAVVPQQIRRVEPPPTDASAAQLESIADELRMQKAYADALDYYHAALKKSDTAVLHNKAGIASLLLFRDDDARREFKHAIRLNPAYPEPHNNLGVIEYRHKNYSKAVKYYKQAIKMRDGSASFHSNLGTAYFGKKDYDLAQSEYARALELDPDVFERREQGGTAARMVDSHDLGRFNYVIAKMYASTGNSDRCLLYLQKAIEEGYTGISNVYKDSEFTNIRKDPRFTALMSAKLPAIGNQ